MLLPHLMVLPCPALQPRRLPRGPLGLGAGGWGCSRPASLGPARFQTGRRRIQKAGLILGEIVTRRHHQLGPLGSVSRLDGHGHSVRQRPYTGGLRDLGCRVGGGAGCGADGVAAMMRMSHRRARGWERMSLPFGCIAGPLRPQLPPFLPFRGDSPSVTVRPPAHHC